MAALRENMRDTIIAIPFACLAMIHLGACHSSSGGAIFYLADDLLGSVRIDRSLITGNHTGNSVAPSPGHAEPGVFLQTATANISITNSTFN
jgi:hypothetical protein